MALTTVTSLSETFESTVRQQERAAADAEKAIAAQLNGVDLGKSAEDEIVDSEPTASPAVANSNDAAEGDAADMA